MKLFLSLLSLPRLVFFGATVVAEGVTLGLSAAEEGQARETQ